MHYYITPDDYETAKQNGIKASTVYERVNYAGWDIERAITTPTRTPKYVWTQWKDKAVVSQGWFHKRMARGMTAEEAALTPVPKDYRKLPKKDTKIFITDEMYERAAKIGIKRGTLYSRINSYKWDIEKALTTPKVAMGGNRKGWKQHETT